MGEEAALRGPHMSPDGGRTRSSRGRRSLSGAVTLRDVAALAGVGIKTVSRVVNNEPGVSPATAEKVRRATAQLGYRADLAAASLRRGDRRTRSIGLLIPSVDNPFAGAVHRGIETVAGDRQVVVLSVSTDDDPEREKRLVGALLQRRVDGLIIAPSPAEQSYLAEELGTHTPVVFIDRHPRGFDADTVTSDNAAGIARATQHLLDRGHRRIAYLGDDVAIGTSRTRFDAFRHTMTEAGLPVDERLVALVRADPSPGGRSAQHTSRLLTEDPAATALLSAQNEATEGALHALRALGPDQRVALVSFDDLPLADLLDPPLTAVAQNPVQIGELAAQRLFGRIDGTITGPAQAVVVETTLRIRGSGEIEPT